MSVERSYRDRKVKSALHHLLAHDSQRAAVLLRTLPFGLFIALLALRGMLPANYAGFGQPDARWLYALQAAVAACPLLLWRKRYAELARIPDSPADWGTSVAVGLAVFALWIAPFPGWAHLGAPAATFVPLDVHGARRWDLIAVRTAGAVLVVPVMEELFWRSFLMRWIDKRDFLDLEPKRAGAFAVLASSAVFALAHDLWLAGLVAGLAFSWVYRRTGTLWCAIAAHATANLALAAWVAGTGSWGYW